MTTTMNAADAGTGMVITGGGLTVTNSAIYPPNSNQAFVRSTASVSTPVKLYLEFHVDVYDSVNGLHPMFGFAPADLANSGTWLGDNGSSGGQSYGAFPLSIWNGQIRFNGIDLSHPWALITGNNIVSVVIDTVSIAGKVGFAYAIDNGTYQGSAFDMTYAVPLYFAMQIISNTTRVTVNFGATAFTYSIPAGYSRWDALGPPPAGGIVTAPRMLPSLPMGLAIGGGAQLAQAIRRNKVQSRRKVLLPFAASDQTKE